jgi:hypothetical protein
VSKRNLILTIVVAVAAFAIGCRVVSRGPTPSRTPGDQSEAGKAASRAMTFTQPKAPAP